MAGQLVIVRAGALLIGGLAAVPGRAEPHDDVAPPTPSTAASAPPAPSTAPPAPSSPTSDAAAPGPLPSPLPPPGFIPIAIVGDRAGLTFELRSASGTQTLVRCPGDCITWVPSGSYRVWVDETDETQSGMRKVNVEAPSRFVVEPRDRDQLGRGLAMGIGGIAAIVAGVAMMLVSVDERSPSTDELLLSVGLVTFVGGCVLTPIGWAHFGKSFRPAVKSERLETRPFRSESIPAFH